MSTADLIDLGGGRWVNPVSGYIAVSGSPEKLACLSGARVCHSRVAGGLLTEEFVEELNRQGFDTLGLEPFHYRYQAPPIEGEHQAMSHQLSTSAFLSSLPRAFCTSDPRTGKTGAIVMALDYLRRVKGLGGAALIVAPLSGLDDTWLKTFRQTLPWASAVVVHGSVAWRRKLLQANYDYFITNFEGLKLLKPELMKMVLEHRLSAVVFDELTHYGNADSDRWKAANAIVNETGNERLRVWGLTGTPGGNSVAVHGYVKLINPARMPYKRQSSWRDAVQSRWGTQPWQFSDRPETPALIHEVMQPAIRFAKDQVLQNLPPLMKVYRRAELSKEQSAAIDQLRNEYRARVRQGETITIQQQSTLVGKIFQIALGAAIGDQGLVRLTAKPRLDLLLEIIRESDRKTVIFRAFTGALDDLVAYLRAKGLTAAKVDGSVGRLPRAQIFSDFQNKAEPHVLVAHPQTVSYGVELAAADQLVFDGPPLNGVQAYLQAIERPMSAKQTAEKVSLIQLTATPEERRFFDQLNEKKGQADMMADLFTFFLKGGAQ